MGRHALGWSQLPLQRLVAHRRPRGRHHAHGHFADRLGSRLAPSQRREARMSNHAAFPDVPSTVVAAPRIPVSPGRPLVEIEDLVVRFGHDGPLVVKGVSFSLYPGECLALIGESGSGKSVTSRTLVGLTG